MPNNSNVIDSMQQQLLNISLNQLIKLLSKYAQTNDQQTLNKFEQTLSFAQNAIEQLEQSLNTLMNFQKYQQRQPLIVKYQETCQQLEQIQNQYQEQQNQLLIAQDQVNYNNKFQENAQQQLTAYKEQIQLLQEEQYKISDEFAIQSAQLKQELQRQVKSKNQGIEQISLLKNEKQILMQEKDLQIEQLNSQVVTQNRKLQEYQQIVKELQQSQSQQQQQINKIQCETQNQQLEQISKLRLDLNQKGEEIQSLKLVIQDLNYKIQVQNTQLQNNDIQQRTMIFNLKQQFESQMDEELMIQKQEMTQLFKMQQLSGKKRQSKEIDYERIVRNLELKVTTSKEELQSVQSLNKKLIEDRSNDKFMIQKLQNQVDNQIDGLSRVEFQNLIKFKDEKIHQLEKEVKQQNEQELYQKNEQLLKQNIQHLKIGDLIQKEHKIQQFKESAQKSKKLNLQECFSPQKLLFQPIKQNETTIKQKPQSAYSSRSPQRFNNTIRSVQDLDYVFVQK